MINETPFIASVRPITYRHERNDAGLGRKSPPYLTEPERRRLVGYIVGKLPAKLAADLAGVDAALVRYYVREMRINGGRMPGLAAG